MQRSRAAGGTGRQRSSALRARSKPLRKSKFSAVRSAAFRLSQEYLVLRILWRGFIQYKPMLDFPLWGSFGNSYCKGVCLSARYESLSKHFTVFWESDSVTRFSLSLQIHIWTPRKRAGQGGSQVMCSSQTSCGWSQKTNSPGM